jgi:catechol 2,3-dioxygenase-like lactoylglutathione lyase family enzyme
MDPLPLGHQARTSTMITSPIRATSYTGKNGSRGTYFRDPNGHLMEILTQP